MKKLYAKFIFMLAAMLALCAFIRPLPAAFAAEQVFDEDYFPMLKAHAIYAKESLAVCAPDFVYEVSFDKSRENKKHDIKNADKALITDKNIFYLSEGALTVFGDAVLATEVVDFDTSASRVAYLKNNAVYSYDIATATSVELASIENAFAIACSDQTVFVACSDGYSTSVYSISSDGSSSASYRHKQKFDSLTLDNEKLYGLTENTVYDFEKKTVVNENAESVTVKNGKYYHLFASNVYFENEFFAGVSSPLYYPRGAILAANKMFCINEGSLKIFDATKDYALEKTINVSASHFDYSITENALYYAKDNILYCLKNGVPTMTEYPEAITDVACGYGAEVYVCAGGLYKNSPQNKIENEATLACVNKSNGEVYYYYSSAIYKDGAKIVTIDSLSDLVADDLGNIYAVRDGKLVAFDALGTPISSLPAAGGEFVSIEQATDGVVSEISSISISYNPDSFARLVACDLYGQNVLITDVQTSNYEVSAASDYEVNNVYTVDSDTVLVSDFSYLPTLSIKAGRTVFCLKYDLDESCTLALIALQNENGFDVGYVAKSALTPVLGTPVSSHYGTAATFYDNTEIYLIANKFSCAPNALLATIADGETEISLLAKFRIQNDIYYKVSYNGIVGYVPSYFVKIGTYEPDVMPNTNATITEDALVYDEQSVPAENVLTIIKNTKVEVLETFDSNKEFTKIRYYDSEAGGTRTCYVKTACLEYDYMTPEQNIAAILIVVSVALIVVCIIVGIKIKFKK